MAASYKNKIFSEAKLKLSVDVLDSIQIEEVSDLDDFDLVGVENSDADENNVMFFLFSKVCFQRRHEIEV